MTAGFCVSPRGASIAVWGGEKHLLGGGHCLFFVIISGNAVRGLCRTCSKPDFCIPEWHRGCAKPAPCSSARGRLLLTLIPRSSLAGVRMHRQRRLSRTLRHPWDELGCLRSPEPGCGSLRRRSMPRAGRQRPVLYITVRCP